MSYIVDDQRSLEENSFLGSLQENSILDFDHLL